jgi:WD40 repeat protein
MTGSILSSLRTSADLSGKTAMGMSSISMFPQTCSAFNTQLVMSYGGNSAKKGDTYAMLLSIRSASSAPILHWKCRLPEADLTGGLLVSPCGYYIVGGGASGFCFVWSSLGGNLLKTFKAHYRSVTCLAWSECGRYLVTGGADGMVHLFLLMDLVDKVTRKSKRTVAPLHTWSFHHFPVTCLTQLNSGRMASAAEDGQVVIMELFSKEIIATIKLPHGVQCLTHHDSRLYAGCTKGTIYSIDLDAYAMHQTEKQGATLTKRQRQEKQAFLVAEEKVFGKSSSDENNRTYQTEWIGHEHPVTSIAILVEDMQRRMISGDEAGKVRIWDIGSRTCLNVIEPWSHVSNSVSKPDAKTKVFLQTHPVSSIMIMPQPSETVASGMFASPANSKGQSSIANLVSPLQKFSQAEINEDGTVYTPVPFVKTNRTAENLQYWEARTFHRKRKTRQTEKAVASDGKAEEELREAKDQVSILQKQLEEKREEIARWEKVNNKLLAKLKDNKQ